MRWLRRKALPEKVQEARDYMHGGGLHENPNDVVFLLLQEVRSLNGNIRYVLGALSILMALLLAHTVTG